MKPSFGEKKAPLGDDECFKCLTKRGTILPNKKQGKPRHLFAVRWEMMGVRRKIRCPIEDAILKRFEHTSDSTVRLLFSFSDVFRKAQVLIFRCLGRLQEWGASDQDCSRHKHSSKVFAMIKQTSRAQVLTSPGAYRFHVHMALPLH